MADALAQTALDDEKEEDAEVTHLLEESHRAESSVRRSAKPRPRARRREPRAVEEEMQEDDASGDTTQATTRSGPTAATGKRKRNARTDTEHVPED